MIMDISAHHTGHVRADDGRLLRIDTVPTRHGAAWVATRFSPDMTVHDMYVGTDEEVHTMVEHWQHRR